MTPVLRTPLGLLALACCLTAPPLAAAEPGAGPHPPVPAPDTGAVAHLTGRLVDAATGAALSGATVMIRGQVARNAVTDSGGQFAVDLPPGRYRLAIAAVGYRSTTREVELKGGARATVTFQLTAQANNAPVKQLPREAAPATAPLPMPPPMPKPSMPSPIARGHAYRQPLVLNNTARADDASNTEAYAHHADNPFQVARTTPLSTFSIDVDTASYSNTRRFLRQGALPPPDAVRVEELINYFHYDDATPTGTAPLAITAEVGPSPWHAGYRMLRVAVRAPAIPDSQVPPRNLVFLIDVSGSMMEPAKLPLLQRGLGLLVDQLRPEDRVAIVTYAGASGLALPATLGTHKDEIRAAINSLEAGGSTNGAAGIELAYQVAENNLKKGGINRVILCTDGDFNVGTTSEGDLVRLIEKKRERGVALTVLGFGMGNLKDATMEQLADKGNGNYAYVDSLEEARKVLVKEAGSTLVTVAKDVKLQLEFNPAQVAGYRLIGYEDRLLAAQNFNDDKKDAGELGAGHHVTALYELVPAGVAVPAAAVDALKYQAPTVTTGALELATIKIRYKAPDATTSKLLSQAVTDGGASLDKTSRDFRWAAAVAGFGMLLRQSPERGALSWAMVSALAEGALGTDTEGYRKEFLHLLELARKLPRS
jgi:Ca-activated chloride channel family protein